MICHFACGVPALGDRIGQGIDRMMFRKRGYQLDADTTRDDSDGVEGPEIDVLQRGCQPGLVAEKREVEAGGDSLPVRAH